MMFTEKSNARHGINIKKYCSEHERYLEKRLSDGDDCQELLRLHELKLRWLQHERLVHLIVTLLISLLFLFSIWLFIALGNPYALILIAVVLVLLGAYIRHYFFLENRVQYWYTMYDRINAKLGHDK